MQQFWYRDAAEYDRHARDLTAGGWKMTHRQSNADGTMSATWEKPRLPLFANHVRLRRWILVGMAVAMGWLLVFALLFSGVLPKDSTDATSPTDSASVDRASTENTLRQCMSENNPDGSGVSVYGDAALPWFQYIQGFQLSGHSMTISTTLFDKASNKDTATRIRNVANVCTSERSLPITAISVQASDDRDLSVGRVTG